MPPHPLADLADSLSPEEVQSGDGRSQPRPSFAAVEAIDFDLYESIVQLKVDVVFLRHA